MTTFQYRAYTGQGVVTVGTIVADDTDSAIDALYAAGLTPFETRKQPGSASERGGDSFGSSNQTRLSIWKREFVRSDQFGLKELTSFTVELASLTDSGLPIDAALRIIAGPGAASKAGQLANALLKDVLAGLQLSEAMSRQKNVFPIDYRAILAAGEAGGFTGQVLRQIAELLTRRLEIRGKVTSALVYPLILVAMSLVSVMVIVFVLVPSVSPIFVDAGLPLPGIIGTLVGMQDNWIRMTIALAIGMVAAFFLWRKFKQGAEFMRAIDRIKCNLPIMGPLIRATEAGRFARALGTLIAAGVPLMSAMQTARALVVNRHLNALYATAIDRVPQGAHVSRAFDGSGLMSPAALRLIAVGEEAGQLSPMLLRIATTSEADLQRRIERLVGLLTPVLTLVVGGSIGALIMQVMAAVLSINELAFK